MSSNTGLESNRRVDVEVAIIGGGIGGLAAAVALRHVGIAAHVYERTKVLREVGGAVLIREPSVRLFEQWEIAEGFLDQAVKVDVIDMRDVNGQYIRSVDADRAGDGASFSVHRADLHQLLLEALPLKSVHLGKECVESSTNDSFSELQFADGTGIRARVVIGADGIKSRIRRLVSNDEPKFAGLVVLRGLAPATALPKGILNDRITMWGQGARMMILLPLRSGREVAMDTVIERKEPPADLWTSEIKTDELLKIFSDFDPSLLDLIRAGVVPVRSNPVYDRDPLHRWSAGSVTLLGDAAHPMAPRMGQGANMAIQDAGVIAATLETVGLERAVEALKIYETKRIKPTSDMQLASRESARVNGIE